MAAGGGVGLEAVSVRKVAAALGAGPMRLYGYLSTKDELLDLMKDAVYAEIAAAGPAGATGRDGWRAGLRSLAHRTRDAALRHEWFADLLGGRPPLGPNALAVLEETLGALHGPSAFTDIDEVRAAAGALNAYLIGAVRTEVAERRARRADGLDTAQWQAASGPYLSRMLATGRFPTLERVMRDAAEPGRREVFEAGLERLLDGLAARLP